MLIKFLFVDGNIERKDDCPAYLILFARRTVLHDCRVEICSEKYLVQ